VDHIETEAFYVFERGAGPAVVESGVKSGWRGVQVVGTWGHFEIEGVFGRDEVEAEPAFVVFPVLQIVEEEVDGFVVCFWGCDEEEAVVGHDGCRLSAVVFEVFCAGMVRVEAVCYQRLTM
jgi:hypothetical protein